MAKKSGSKGSKKNAGGGKKASAKKEPVDPAKKAEHKFIGKLDAALEVGSYAGVRQLAEQASTDLSPEAQAKVEERVALTRVDPVQVGVAAFAILMVVIAVVTTLTPASEAHKQGEAIELTE